MTANGRWYLIRHLKLNCQIQLVAHYFILVAPTYSQMRPWQGTAWTSCLGDPDGLSQPYKAEDRTLCVELYKCYRIQSAPQTHSEFLLGGGGEGLHNICSILKIMLWKSRQHLEPMFRWCAGQIKTNSKKINKSIPIYIQQYATLHSFLFL